MMEFNLATALEKLEIDLDPYPTQSFRKIVNCLRNIVIIVEEIHKVRICCLIDLFAKLSLKPEVQPEKNSFVSTAEVYNMLRLKEIPGKFASTVTNLLLYIVIKLQRCSGNEAPSILLDFYQLEPCITKYRENSIWDNSNLDQVVMKFTEKLIQMLKGLTAKNRAEKYELFSVMRVMVLQLGRLSIYSPVIVKQVTAEVNSYHQQVVALEDHKVDSFVHENHLNYLHILNELIGRNFINKNKEVAQEVLSNLQNVLDDIMLLNKMSPREAYLVRNIMGIVGIYLSA